MKAFIFNGNIINWGNVNNINKICVVANEKYKIKVNMVNGSAFETEATYTEEEADKELAFIVDKLM